MKKILFIITLLILICPVYAAADRYSEEYLKNKMHFAIMNPIVEHAVQQNIKKAILKESKGKYKVKFDAYTVASLKQGIFKYLEIIGKDITFEGYEIPYVNLKTETDYNWIDYKSEPIIFKSDIVFNSEIHLTEKIINQALQTTKYKNNLQKVNKRAYPLFVINDIRIRIRHDKVHIIMDYNFPIVPMKKNRTFMVSSGFNIDNGKIKAYNIGIDNAYGNLPIDKVANLVNLLDPLSFTINLFETKQCDIKTESITIEDNTVITKGKICIKGDAE